MARRHAQGTYTTMIPTEPMSAAGTLGTFLISLIVIGAIIAMVVQTPKLVAFGFLGLIFLFADSTYGSLTVESNLYSRGSGIFYFSLINLSLLVAGFAVLCKKLANPGTPQLAPPVSKYGLAMAFLLLCHLVVGLMSGIAPNVILGYSGVINILNMFVLMYIVIEAVKNEEDQQQLLLVIIGLAAVRAVFGLVRYAFFGGDSANPYKNFDNLDIKLAFFDIGDNFICSIGAFCAAWLLTSPHARMSAMKRLAVFGLLVLQVAAVGLSFRRSSLIGLALMFALLVFRLPGRQRVIVILFATGFITAILAVFFRQRLQYAAGDSGGGILSSLVFDIARDNVEDSRFYELYAAAQSLGGNWLIGLGSWGTFSGDEELLFYHYGKMDFIHSGFGHIVLKTGVIGLVLFCGMLLAYTAHYFRTRKYLSGNALLISDAGFAGLLFWIPTLLIGTPIIEFRTMLLIGLTLAMPFVAARVESHRPRVHTGYQTHYAPAQAA
ncbi:MAG: hypothetical protein V7606_1526 [Burkholderiales bacterium]